jgi:membrane fusion protein (multidrug efflux system)
MSKNKNIYIAAVVIGVIGIAALVVDYFSAKPAKAAAPEQTSVQISTQAVEKRSLANNISAFGDVVAGHTLGISSAYPAQVSSLLVMQGQKVKKDEPLVILAADPAAQLSYQQALSTARLSGAELGRTKELFRLQLATQSQLDTTQKAYDDARAALATQKNLGGVASAPLNAPEEGIVTALTVAQGDRVAAGAPMMQLGVVKDIKIVLGIDPADRLRVAKGTVVTITSLDDPNISAQGTIGEVQDAIDPKTQLTNVVVRMNAANRYLVPGMRVRAALAAEPQEAFAVQRQAVLNDDKGAYLFQVVQSKAHRVDVHTVIDNRDILGVTGKVDPHLPVVVLGNYELSDGMPVREAAK